LWDEFRKEYVLCSIDVKKMEAGAMRFKVMSLWAAVFSLGIVQAASAADMSTKAPAYAPVAVYNWTGFYVGASVGGQWLHYDATVTVPPAGGVVGATRSQNTASVRAGGYAGYNWQIAPMWVVGLEGDYAWGNNSQTTAFFPGAPVANVGDSTTAKQKWDASARVRAGYLLTPAWLLYATGGAAWEGIDATANCSAATCGAVLAQTNSTTRSGWTVGGGIEYMFARNWIARAEYRYADYGTWTSTFFTGVPATTIATKITANTAYAGIAYKF
jgi:outer membrane immunogenic protein